MGLYRDLSWPKGMEPREASVEKEPVPLTLADGNYAGVIRLALDALPVVVRVDRLIVVERAGCSPQVRLALTIIGQKEDANER